MEVAKGGIGYVRCRDEAGLAPLPTSSFWFSDLAQPLLRDRFELP